MLFQLPFGLLYKNSPNGEKLQKPFSHALNKTSIERICSSTKKGGALASTHRWKRGRHVEDGSLASLKTGPKQINADHEDLALAA